MILKWAWLCGFGRFSEVHVFEKPNDEHALNLMNSCAVAVMEKLPDLVFSYGVSDEYRYLSILTFVLNFMCHFFSHDSDSYYIFAALF